MDKNFHRKVFAAYFTTPAGISEVSETISETSENPSECSENIPENSETPRHPRKRLPIPRKTPRSPRNTFPIPRKRLRNPAVSMPHYHEHIRRPPANALHPRPAPAIHRPCPPSLPSLRPRGFYGRGLWRIISPFRFLSFRLLLGILEALHLSFRNGHEAIKKFAQFFRVLS